MGAEPLLRQVGAQDDGRMWTSFLPVRITTVDFPVIYVNIAALLLCPMPTYATASRR
jgi:hypothetical protein